MKNFTYRATDYSGISISGAISSETESTAARDLTAKGLYIISLRESSGLLHEISKKIQGAQIKGGDILEFTGNLSVMLKSGIPIIACLGDIITSTENSAFKTVLRDIQQRVETGSSLSVALEAHGDLFPGIIKTLVAVGEETGRLHESLGEATLHLQRLQEMAAAIKKALMYPIFAFIATMGSLFFWMIFVIPSMTQTLKGMGVKLPPLTVILINSSKLFQTHWKMIPLLLIAIPLLYIAASKNRQFRYYRDRLMMKLPLFKIVLSSKLLATFAEQFRMMIVADIPMKRLFDLLVPALDNEYFARNLYLAKDDILNGKPISESLEQRKILPPLIIGRVRTGETSGTLDKQLDFLAKYYSQKLNDATENLGKIIEPVVMSVIGALFALIIMGLLLPIYDLVSNVGKS